MRRRRFHRRRVYGVSALTVAGLAGGSLAAALGGETTATDRPPTAPSSSPPRDPSDWTWYAEPRPARDLPGLVIAAGFADVPSGGSNDPSTDMHTMAMVSGTQVGYASVTITTTEHGDLCDTPVHPFAGVGRTCSRHSDGLGNWAVIEWPGSDQGPTRMTRIAHAGVVVSFTVSQGHPRYEAADVSMSGAPQHDLDLLPWDLRNPLDPESGEMRTEPLVLEPLPEIPLSESRQLELARYFLGSDSR